MLLPLQERPLFCSVSHFSTKRTITTKQTNGNDEWGTRLGRYNNDEQHRCTSQQANEAQCIITLSRTAVNPQVPIIKAKALVLFNVRSQLSFMSTNLANRLRVKGEDKSLYIIDFGNQTSVSYQTMKTAIKTKLNSNEFIQVKVYRVDHLTNNLQVANPTELIWNS